MKKSAIFTLVKHILMAVAFAAFGYFAFNSSGVDAATSLGLGIGLFAGIPFGWSWASKIITAVSLQGVGIKLLFSVALGWLAIFVVLIGDIIRCFTAPREAAAA